MPKYGKSISLSNELEFTQNYITEMSLWIGIRKYGKSYGVGVLEEEFLESNWPFIIIDPMGIHYALRAYKSNILIIGGPHEDLSLTDKNIMIAIKRGYKVIFDVSEHDINQQRVICTNIMSCVKALVKSPLNVIIEESDIFVPQNRGDIDCKDIIIWLARKGRQQGVGMTLICQRYQGRQSIDKDVISQVDNYVIFKMDSPSDIPVLKKLIPIDAVREVMKFNPGECYVKSNRYTGVTKIKERRIEHQGSSPQLGVTRKPLKLRGLNKSIKDNIIIKQQSFLEKLVDNFWT